MGPPGGAHFFLSCGSARAEKFHESERQKRWSNGLTNADIQGITLGPGCPPIHSLLFADGAGGRNGYVVVVVHAVNEIMQVPIVKKDSPGILIWKPAKSGECSTKEARRAVWFTGSRPLRTDALPQERWNIKNSGCLSICCPLSIVLWKQVVMLMVESDVSFGLGKLNLPLDEVRSRVSKSLDVVGMLSYLQMGVIKAVRNSVAADGEVATLWVTHRLEELEYDGAIYTPLLSRFRRALTSFRWMTDDSLSPLTGDEQLVPGFEDMRVYERSRLLDDSLGGKIADAWLVIHSF
ncbi:hypothetical protein U9M48_039060 [Paspalum notatum var. saurae]|uniref:Uncharacterized protein n=1 Tax=Paspalum notatum var. saurae TaxID=547442 RepID=A0AAQ3UMN9_PASNO